MKFRKSSVAATLAAGLLLAALPVGAAHADLTSELAGGGLFQYGVEGGYVYSNFHHASKYHTATACNNGLIDRCKQVAAVGNAWAKAKNASSLFGGNKAYWNVL